MIIKEHDGILTVENVRDFNLDHIFDCGQCFRWEKTPDGKYFGTAYGRHALMGYEKDEERLTIYGADKEDFDCIWRHYLDLDRDYSVIKQTLAQKTELLPKR